MLPGIQYIRPLVDHAIPAALCRCDDLRRPVCACGNPSLCDTCDDTAYGQDANWVRINFARLQALDPALTNAEQVLSIGYSNWVDAMVGIGLTNGLYKFTASFPSAPTEPTQLFVGDYSLCVTNAGEYSFVLLKGVDYEFGTWPFDDTVDYWAEDDLGDDAPMLMSGGVGSAASGQWTVDGGWLNLIYPASGYSGSCLWMPTLRGAPDVGHLGPDDFPKTFFAVLTDCCPGIPVSYQWSASEMTFRFSAPNAQSTSVDCLSLPSWGPFSISVEANVGEHTLCSELRGTYGENDAPQVSCKLEMPETTLFLNDDHRSERYYALDVVIASDAPTNGTYELLLAPGTEPYLCDESNADIEQLQHAFTIESFGGTFRRTFHFRGAKTGESNIELICMSGGLPASSANINYRVVEPLRRLVCCEVGEDGCNMNPSALVCGHQATFMVEGAGGEENPQGVTWQISGPVNVVERRGPEIVVEPTASSGMVSLTARFNSDVIQPTFRVPIVQERVIPIRFFTPSWERKRVSRVRGYVQSALQVANAIFRQVGIQFLQAETLTSVGSSGDWTVAVETIHSSDGRDIHRASTQLIHLLDSHTDNDCIEVYIIGGFVDQNGEAVCGVDALYHKKGILIPIGTDLDALAHELGHALGLEDCFDCIGNTLMLDAERTIGESSFASAGFDWGDETKRGFYATSDSERSVMQKLLMYWDSGSGNSDIPSGAYWGLKESASSVNEKSNVLVGRMNISITNEEVFSE